MAPVGRGAAGFAAGKPAPGMRAAPGIGSGPAVLPQILSEGAVIDAVNKICPRPIDTSKEEPCPSPA